MTNIDQFESVFKAADKTPFQLEQVKIRSVLVVTSSAAEAGALVQEAAQLLLTCYRHAADLIWTRIDGHQFHDVDRLLELIEHTKPDLICTYRNLHAPAPDHPYSLGSYVDVITQTLAQPVLLLPTPTRLASRDKPLAACQTVMAITDHLTGDNHLVSFAAQLTSPDGTLFLTHVEDQRTFIRYMQTIEKISAIDTDIARERILEQLLKEPHDYILAAREIVRQAMPRLQIEELVVLGDRLSDYQRLISDRDVDLLVMNAKDKDQLAMHGLAYPLAVELRDTPLLLL